MWYGKQEQNREYTNFFKVLAYLECKKLSPSFKFFQIANVFFAWWVAFFAPYGDGTIPPIS
jgi:hypothetical protein